MPGAGKPVSANDRARLGMPPVRSDYERDDRESEVMLAMLDARRRSNLSPDAAPATEL